VAEDVEGRRREGADARGDEALYLLEVEHERKAVEEGLGDEVVVQGVRHGRDPNRLRGWGAMGDMLAACDPGR